MHHYDVLPYESHPFRETHPQFLAALGRLFGLPVADPARCRVLELGCAAGGNLIPMAWHWPQSEFVGIDLEASQIRDGQALAAELSLDNIRLAQGDILRLGEELGRFDYIVAHGVYSWVPEPVREAMLALCRRLLQPQGIAYISYNTRPGWHVRGMLREMLLYHVRGVDDAVARLNKAYEFLELLSDTLPLQARPLAKHLLQEVEYLRKAHPSYVYHEYLETYNAPVLVAEFLAQVERYGLRYLCESELHTMFASSLGPRVEQFLDQFPDQASQEQYLDMLTQRTFRQSLLCHADAVPDYNIDLERLDQFACHANLQPPEKLDVRHDRAQALLRANGKPVEVAQPLCKAMLKQLYEVYPSAVALTDLLTAARETLQAAHGKKPLPAETSAWRGEWFNLVANGQVTLCLEPVVHDNSIPVRPKLNALARAQVRRGIADLATVWHGTLNTDAFSARLALHLDGTRDRRALTEQLLLDVADGSLPLPDLPAGEAQRRRILAANLERMLDLFARGGLLEEARP